MIISLIIWFIFSLTIAYLVVIGVITFGWNRLSIDYGQAANFEDIDISVLIAVRNESENIGRLLENILTQNYNQELFDIIVVDDHSSDDTVEIVRSLIKKSGKRLSLIDASGNGKKNAIREGISTSSSRLIVTTDGDCEVPQGWLSAIVDYYRLTDKKVICGPVNYNNHKTLFQKFVTLDFASLVASGAGSIGSGLPLMGNGANLAFERDVFLDFNDDSSAYASGDDVFLIHHATKKYGSDSIGFLKNEDAIVGTPPPLGFVDFMKQRIRWASKAKGYRMVWPLVVSLTVFLFNIVLFLLLASSVVYSWLLPVYGLLILTKLLIDLPLVFRYLTFSKMSGLKPYFIFLEIIYPIYIVVASILSLTIKYEWKQRKSLN